MSPRKLELDHGFKLITGFRASLGFRGDSLCYTLLLASTLPVRQAWVLQVNVSGTERVRIHTRGACWSWGGMEASDEGSVLIS